MAHRRKIQQTPSPSIPLLPIDSSLEVIDVKPIVEALDQNQAKTMEIHKEQNNLYGTLRVQEEQYKQQIRSIKELLHDVKHGKRKVGRISVPYGMGQVYNLEEKDTKEYLQSYMKQLEIAENQLKSIVGQRQHRSDEVGEMRLKILRMFWYILHTQHGFKDEELYEHCREYVELISKPSEMKMIQPLEIIEDTIKKAKEIQI